MRSATARPSGVGGSNFRLVRYATAGGNSTSTPGTTKVASDDQRCGAQQAAAGTRVFGLSTQDTAYQREAAARLHLPFPLLSDQKLRLTTALGLPTMEIAGATLLKRQTLIVRDGVVEHLWYPVFPPDRHADEVLLWLHDNHADPLDLDRRR